SAEFPLLWPTAPGAQALGRMAGKATLVTLGRQSPLAVFLAFLRLGVTSFGGPVAHLGYFRAEFVGRRGWLDDGAFAECVAVSQLLPGPASSQTGMLVGWLAAGPVGAVAAWLGFTAPSAIAMAVIAMLLPRFAAG